MADPTNSADGDMPEPTEEYQKKLKEFIARVPALPPGKTEGPEIVSGTPPLSSRPKRITEERIQEIAKSIVSDSLFTNYTGYDHLRLLRRWCNDSLTTCNDFVTRCTTEMGYTGEQVIGRFDIADQLSSRLSHAWVPADSGSEPEYGDVFRLYDSVPDANGMRLNHMAMSLGLNGTDWYTVEAGQGGPGKGFDSLRRKKRIWKPSALGGWVSMRAMMNVNKPLPFWLGGWWQVQESGDDNPYFYYFSSNGKVSYTRITPASFLVPLTRSSLVGSFSSKHMFEVEISWNSEDVNEKFTVYGDQKNRKYTFDGKTDLGTKLKAKRLMLNNAFD